MVGPSKGKELQRYKRYKTNKRNYRDDQKVCLQALQQQNNVLRTKIYEKTQILSQLRPLCCYENVTYQGWRPWISNTRPFLTTLVPLNCLYSPKRRFLEIGSLFSFAMDDVEPKDKKTTESESGNTFMYNPTNNTLDSSTSTGVSVSDIQPQDEVFVFCPYGQYCRYILHKLPCDCGMPINNLKWRPT